MTARTPTALKLFFETGDKPSQSNFGDLLDSYVNVVQTSGQSIVSDVSALGTLDVAGSAAFKSNVSVSGNLAVRGAVSAGGNFFVNGAFSVTTLSATTVSAVSLFANGNSKLGTVIVSADSGLITPTGIKGTTTNNNAASGVVGEYFSSEPGTPASLSGGVAADITFIALTPGDWDVWANFQTNPAGGTQTQSVNGWISTQSATNPASTNGGAYFSLVTSIAAGVGVIFPIGMKRISVATSTNAYLSTLVNFTVSTMGAYGFIGARRVR